MKHSMLVLIAGLALSCPAAAQTGPRVIPAVFSYTYTPTNTATLTLQQPASNARTTQVLKVYIYCPAACVIEQWRNGTAATATAVAGSAIARHNPENGIAPTLTLFTASDVNNASAHVLPKIELTAAGGTTLDFTDETSATGTMYLVGAGTTKNYSIKVTVTGVWRASPMWREHQ